MGMYTELVMALELKEDAPDYVIEELSRASRMGQQSRFYWFHVDSYYFAGDSMCVFRYDDIARAWFLTLRCNLKNYQNQIEEFCEWIAPHINNSSDGFVGYMRYEENPTPTLIYIVGPDNKVIYQTVNNPRENV